MPTNGGTLSGGGSWRLAAGQTVTTSLSAIPNPGYDFDRWTEDGTTLSTDSVYLSLFPPERSGFPRPLVVANGRLAPELLGVHAPATGSCERSWGCSDP
ncbi:InlB B-repeat-containing protein [Candidatus Palauibacter sp.]|uniref:InlB B-repeat-containing protein n=1 Tax=Candidatus Palauibacter sp. TaxID=3101350 RepID=UPI003B01722D